MCAQPLQSAGVARHARGFTLVEVMVALMIVAIALPALMAQIGAQLDGREYVRDRLLASWVAQEQWSRRQLQLAASPAAVSAGDSRGEVELAGRRWYWQQSSEPTPAPGVLKHTIRVALSAEQTRTAETALFSLETWLPVSTGISP